jgi:cation diffusion facilitator family transporter
VETDNLEPWKHDHSFGQDRPRVGERRTWIVIAITATMMVVEIVTGLLFGSMALLADGLHMASHTAALGITVFAYRYARRHARDRRFTFGTGKVNALAGFSSAVLLAVFALIMVSESVRRFFEPVAIRFDDAILVAVLGLLVNAVSVFILGGHHEGDKEHPAEEGHGHDHAHHDPHHDHHDHNLRAAYFHVLADALTSLLAIFALLTGKYLGAIWMDPLMGIVGAILVARWAWGLVRGTSRVLLDRQAPEETEERVRRAIESRDGDRVVDLHVWSIGPGIFAATICIVSDRPRLPAHYRGRLPADLGLVHTTIEVHPRT